MKYVEILARNVYITPEETKLIKEFRDNCNNENAKRWVDTVYRRFLINEYAQVEPIYKYKPSMPSWVKDSLESGKEVLGLRELSADRLHHYSDFLNTLSSTKDLTRMSFDQFLDKLYVWEDSFIKEAEGVGTTRLVHKLSDNYTLVELLDEAALDYEGSKMNHCVGSYGPEIESGNTKIYSIRDAANIPHVTFEFDNTDKTIEQTKGNSNKIPTKYVSYILEVLNNKYIPFKKIILADISGLVFNIDNKYVTKEEYSKLISTAKHIDYVTINSQLDFAPGVTINKLKIRSPFGEPNNFTLPNCTIKTLEIDNANVTFTDKVTVDRIDISKSTVKFTELSFTEFEAFNSYIIADKLKGNFFEMAGCLNCNSIESKHIYIVYQSFGNIHKFSCKNFEGDNLVLSHVKSFDSKIKCEKLELMSCSNISLSFNTLNSVKIYNCNNIKFKGNNIAKVISEDKISFDGIIKHFTVRLGLESLPNLTVATINFDGIPLNIIKRIMKSRNLKVKSIITQDVAQCKKLYPNIEVKELK
jgi:hypothetical protein